MTNRMKLLAAVAAVALPAAMAGAQSTAPGGGAARAGAPQPTTPPTQTTPAQTPTTNSATEDAQPADTQNAATPAPVNQNAEPSTQTQATTQAQTPPATPLADQPAPAAQAQATTQAQAGTPAAAAAGPSRAAAAADLHAGVQVRDQAGGAVGTVETADATGAVVSTGTTRVRLPLASFGVNGQGLVISMTRGQLEAAAAHAQPQPSAG